MSRYVRNTAILAKIETTSGIDAVPSPSTDAMLVSNFTPNPLNATMVARPLVRPFFGDAESIVGTAYIELSFDVELAGSGVAGTAPMWGRLLRAAAFAEVVTALSRVDYTPITSSQESVTIYYYDDGVMHKLLYAKGDASIKMGINGIPMLAFKFIGLDGGLVAVASPSVTLAAWQRPLAVTDANTGDITLGCTYAAGALSGGTPWPSRGLDLAFGGALSHIPLLGGETVDITNRVITGKIVLDLPPAQEVANMAIVKASITQGFGLTHGTVAGNKALFFAPAAQMLNPSKQDVSGRRLIGYDLKLVPSAGNDDLRIVAL